MVSINECTIPDQLKISEVITFLILNNTFLWIYFKTRAVFVSHMTLLVQTMSEKPLLSIKATLRVRSLDSVPFYGATIPTTKRLFPGAQLCIYLYFNLTFFFFFYSIEGFFFFLHFYFLLINYPSLMLSSILIKKVFFSKLSIKTLNRTEKRLLGMTIIHPWDDQRWIIHPWD